MGGKFFRLMRDRTYRYHDAGTGGVHVPESLDDSGVRGRPESDGSVGRAVALCDELHLRGVERALAPRMVPCRERHDHDRVSRACGPRGTGTGTSRGRGPVRRLALLCALLAPGAHAQALGGGSLAGEALGPRQGVLAVSGSTAGADAPAPPPGPPSSAADMVAWGRALATLDAQSPAAVSQAVTVDGETLPPYDLAILDGPHTVSAFSAGAYFTATEDSRPAVVVVKGDLTVNASQTFTPSVRKPFVYLYVDGACVINGEVSMSHRGANHSASGSDLVAARLRIYTGTLSAVVDPQIPAAGGAGAVSPTLGAAGLAGGAGTGGGTGGGGSGGVSGVGGVGSSGTGAAGTSYSGGSGTGAARGIAGPDAEARGGAGGDAAIVAGQTGNRGLGGGAGNPGGTQIEIGTATADAGAAGSGGVLVVVCEGALSGSGAVVADGAAGGSAASAATSSGGGGSGGGSVSVLAASGTVTTTANGGPGGTGSTQNGGAGGLGTARVLTGGL
jgi:hypothetical protein